MNPDHSTPASSQPNEVSQFLESVEQDRQRERERKQEAEIAGLYAELEHERTARDQVKLELEEERTRNQRGRDQQDSIILDLAQQLQQVNKDIQAMKQGNVCSKDSGLKTDLQDSSGLTGLTGLTGLNNTGLKDTGLRDKGLNITGLNTMGQHSNDKIFAGQYSSGLSISDPDTDVLTELFGCIRLRRYLCNEKQDVMTVQRLYRYTLEKAKELSTVISSRAHTQSVRSVLAQFGNQFAVHKDVDRETMLFIKLLGIKDQCKELLARLETAVQLACTLTDAERSDVQVEAAKGRLPSISDNFATQTIRELPGIKELLNADSAQESKLLLSFNNLIESYICHDPKLLLKIEAAEAAFAAFDGSQEGDCETFIRTFEKLYNAVLSLVGGNFKSDREKIKCFLQGCPLNIRARYAKHVTEPTTKVDTVLLQYSTFKSLIREVWEYVTDHEQLEISMGLQSGSQCDQSSENKSLQQTSTNLSQGQSADGLHNIQLQCKGCDNSFVWTVAKQQEHAKHGYTTQPRWGPCCRHKKPCYSFVETGKCSYGEDCDFSHDSALRAYRSKSADTSTDDESVSESEHTVRGFKRRIDPNKIRTQPDSASKFKTVSFNTGQ